MHADGTERSGVTEVQLPEAVAFTREWATMSQQGDAQRSLGITHPMYLCVVEAGRRARIEVGAAMENLERAKATNLSEADEEARKIRRLQIMMSMVMSVISQDPDLTIEEASEMAANSKRAALAMFPDKEFAYDILYKPRLQRLMNERFRIQ